MPLFRVLYSLDREFELYSHECEYHANDVHMMNKLKSKLPFRASWVYSFEIFCKISMIITPLGHTEFLVDIANKKWENVRILVDTWLSDYVIGDLLERTVQVRLDPEKLKTIDAIYISHAHSDHLDVYTLIDIYKYASPILILPFTLRYLESLFQEFLPDAPIQWLSHREIFLLKGVEIVGYMWSNPEISNEDDVMMIAISNDRELVFAEIDTIPDLYHEWVQKSLYSVFTHKEYDTRLYLMSRNYLEGQIPLYDLLPNKRKAFCEKYIADQKEDILASYERYEYEEYAHFPNLFTLRGFVRWFIGDSTFCENSYHVFFA